MLSYNKKSYRHERYRTNGERLFRIQYMNGFEGHLVDVDGNKEIEMIIQEHTNPLNEGLLDKKAKFLTDNGDFFHIGNVIYVRDENLNYLAVTNPNNNGVYSEYRIRPLTDDIKFINSEEEISLEGILASGLLYKDSSYTNQANVFEDNEMKAIIVQYTDRSKDLSLFDSIRVNNVNYKIAKVDKETLKEYDKEYGIIQFVVFLVPNQSKVQKFDVVNDTTTEFKGLIKYARVKDRKLNSVSRELLCEYQTVKTGDYIKYSFDCDDKGNIQDEIYMVYNVPSKYDGYDISLVYRCINSFKMLNDVGEIKEIPYYFEDNRTRIDKTTNNDQYNNFNSSYMIIMQENDITKKFVTREVSRIILKDTAYKITGVNNLDEGLLSLGLEIDEYNLSEDMYGVADYVSQKSKSVSGTNEALYIDGETRIFKGFNWEYKLVNKEVIGHGTTWSTNSDYIDIISFNDEGCLLRVKNKYPMGASIILSAQLDNIVVEKIITLE